MGDVRGASRFRSARGESGLHFAPLAATHAVFPGTFDPPTLGHLDIVRRAAALFGRLTLALADHPTKSALFDADARIELLRRATAEIPGVSVVRLGGLLVEGCREVGATAIVRGVRCGTDFDYEVQMAHTNHELAPEVETVLLAPSPEVGHITSTLVRQIASLGGDVRPFVPTVVAEALRERFG